eukprot:jgi/Picsp_1/3561/NSC_06398-R1_expressed protein [Chlorella variabilis]
MERVDVDTTSVKETTSSFEHVDLGSEGSQVSQHGSGMDDSVVIDKDGEKGLFATENVNQEEECAEKEQDSAETLQNPGVDNLAEDDTGEIQPEKDATGNDHTIHQALDQEQGMSRTADAYSNEEQGKSPHSSKDPVVREFEEAAAVAAAVTKEAAVAAQQKLMKASKEMRGFMSSLWSSFDGPLKQNEEKDVMHEIKEKLGLDEDENILESFRCKLIQHYMPSNNAFTQPKSIGFAGQLHIASAHIGFELDSGSSSPICVSRNEIKGVTQEEMCIIVTLSGGRSLIFGHFSFPRLEVESAFTLLNKLCPP